jgi:diadenosine tetraphosphate (Ap4A) HIT family hydrolase
MENCVICNLPKNTIVWDNQYGFVSFWPQAMKPGHLVIALKEHKPDLQDLTIDELQAITQLMHKAASRLQVVFSPAKIYTLSVGDIMPHFHFHQIPRLKTESPVGPYIFGDNGWRPNVFSTVSDDQRQELVRTLRS